MMIQKTSRFWFATGALAVAASMCISTTPLTAAKDPSNDWVTSWAAAVTAADPGSSQAGFNNQTYRNGVHLSVGGNQIRIKLTNIYGTQTVVIGHATVAKSNRATPQVSDVVPSTLRELTFQGRPTATILKGDDLYSDPVDLTVDDGDDLIVSMYFPTATGPASWHVTSKHDNFRGAGDLAGTTDGPWDFQRVCCWFFLSGVDVLQPRANGAVAVLGTSISDGNGSTQNANTRWPDLLAKRLGQKQGNNKQAAVVNLGLSGNRLNHEGPENAVDGFTGGQQFGRNAGARLNDDVFALTGVTAVVVELGIDDIWMNGDDAQAIIDGLQNLAERLRQHGLEVIVSTITPFHGMEQAFGLPNAWSPAKETTRNAVNAFIRTGQGFDAVVDFDAVLRDPADATKLRAEFDAGDHFHPNDAGAQQMANALPLSLIQ